MTAVVSSRRAALTGSLSAIAAGLVSPAIAASSNAHDPIMDLYRQHEALDAPRTRLYQRAESRSATLTAQYKGLPKPAGASDFFWYDFDDPELQDLIDQIEALSNKMGYLADKIQGMPAVSKEGVMAKLRIALSLCPPMSPDLDFHVTAAIDAMQDALRVLEVRQ